MKIWPQTNQFLVMGFEKITTLFPDRFQDVMFVDFSLHNLHFFTDTEWLRKIKSREFKIVLVYDRHLEALANFWDHSVFGKHCVKIVPVNKLRSFLVMADELPPDFKIIKKNTLTVQELLILHLMVAGNNADDIASTLECSRGHVYYLKKNIEYKMDVRFRHLGRRIKIQDSCQM